MTDAAPPPPPQPQQQPPGPQQPYPPYTYAPMHPGTRVGTNGLAIASLVLGILWLGGIGAVLAIIFGLIALSQIRSSQEGGRGLAIAGTILGVVGTVGVVLLVALTFAIGTGVHHEFHTTCVQINSGRSAPPPPTPFC